MPRRVRAGPALVVHQHQQVDVGVGRQLAPAVAADGQHGHAAAGHGHGVDEGGQDVVEGGRPAPGRSAALAQCQLRSRPDPGQLSGACRQSASPPISPVRMRITPCATGRSDPHLAVADLAGAERRDDGLDHAARPRRHRRRTSTRDLRHELDRVLRAPVDLGVAPAGDRSRGASDTVMPVTPASPRAALTSSSLNGLMMAMTTFIRLAHGSMVARSAVPAGPTWARTPASEGVADLLVLDGRARSLVVSLTPEPDVGRATLARTNVTMKE